MGTGSKTLNYKRMTYRKWSFSLQVMEKWRFSPYSLVSKFAEENNQVLYTTENKSLIDTLPFTIQKYCYTGRVMEIYNEQR